MSLDTQEVAETLIKELRSKIEESPGVGENVMLALSALAIALPPAAHSFVEAIMETITTALKKPTTNDWVKVQSLLRCITQIAELTLQIVWSSSGIGQCSPCAPPNRYGSVQGHYIDAFLGVAERGR